MSIDTLGAIFNSQARVKIMRFFLLNPTTVLTPGTLASRSNITSATARKEINILARGGFVARGKTKEKGKKSKDGWMLNSDFEYVDAMNNLLFGTEFVDPNDLAKRLKRAGRIKVLVLSGVFNGTNGARLDLLLVGDNLKRPVIDRVIRSLEAEIGKELAYAIFETPDFIYRASMYDKLIRDIMDSPHEKIINMGGILEQISQIVE